MSLLAIGSEPGEQSGSSSVSSVSLPRKLEFRSCSSETTESVEVLGELLLDHACSAVRTDPVKIDCVGDTLAFFLFPRGDVRTEGGVPLSERHDETALPKRLPLGVIGVKRDPSSPPVIDRARFFDGVFGVWGVATGRNGGDDALGIETSGKAMTGPQLSAEMGPRDKSEF
jgi:hypothetical protein